MGERRFIQLARIEPVAVALPKTWRPFLCLFVCCLFLPAAWPVHAMSVAAGAAHSLLLRDDGTLWTWGYNVSGQLGDGTTASRATPVQVLTDVKAVAANDYYSMAIKTDGTLWAWGENSAGQLGDGTKSSHATPVQVLSGVSAVAAGGYHTMALKTDGTLWAWGDNSRGQLGDGSTIDRVTPVRMLSGVRAVIAGYYHSLAIKSDGTLWAWGDNGRGQLGDSTTVSRALPVQVLTGVGAVVAGVRHTVAIKTDGTQWAWGDNSSGQLGDGTTESHTAPVSVPAEWQALAAGGYHTMAIKPDGTLWVWGSNFSGQLGDGTTTSRATPVQVLAEVKAVAANTYHTVVIRTDNTVWAWGDNSLGTLGDGTTESRATPVQALAGVRTAVAGGNRTLAVRTDGTLWTWGDNTNGQLGDGTTVGRALPVQVLSNVQAAAAGYAHTFAIKGDGTLWAWGNNSSGQLGDGTTASHATPMQVLSGVQAVAAGGYHSLALKTDGTVWAWGDNTYGELGDGTTVGRVTPVQVLTGVRAVAAGFTHSLAIKTDGTLWAWGSNNQPVDSQPGGQLGDGSTVNRATPVQVLSEVQAVAAGHYHSLAIKTDGTLWAWGWNSRGQLGDGTTTSRLTPVQVLAGVRVVAAGWDHTLAIKSDGALWAWGDNSTQALGASNVVPTPRQSPTTASLFLVNLSQVAAGYDHSVAVTNDGRALVWGDNRYQQLGLARSAISLVPLQVRDPLARYANSDLVVEFFNPTIRNGAGRSGIGHYFISAFTAEQASIDGGGSGPGWTRTGRTFRAWLDPANAPAGAAGVCRFYAHEPNSHFYTASATECQGLRNLNPANDPAPGWSYEGIAFYTVLPLAGGCPVGYFPVYRAYNNRFGAPATNDGNHRLTPSYGDYQRAIRFFGYVDEGIAFCSPSSPKEGGDLQATYSYPGAIVAAGHPVAVEFLFSNNGAGSGDGGTIYAALPREVTDWSLSCTARFGVTCPPQASLVPDLIRTGLIVSTWPANGGMTITATGTAPQVAAGGTINLLFAAAVTNASGYPDGTPANDAPPISQTAVKAASACSFAVNPASLAVGATAQTAHVALTVGGDCAWSAQSGANWIGLSIGAANPAAAAGGRGDATVVLTIAANATATARQGTVTIGGQTVTVSQAGIVCTFALDPASLASPATGGSTTVLLAARDGCAWTVQSGADWLSATPTSGSGTAALTVTTTATASVTSRSASLTIGTQTMPVSQSGTTQVTAAPPPAGDPCATLRLQRDGDQVAAAGMTGTLTFNVQADTLCVWRALANVSWITLTAGSGASGNGIVGYLIDANPDIQTRNGTITIGNKFFTVNQVGVPASSGNDGGGDGSGGSGGGGSGGGAG